MNLKIVFTCIVGLTVGINCYAEGEKVKAKSEVKEVTVFSGTAQIKRKAWADVRAGKNTLVIAGLSEYIDPQTVQVALKGNVTIMSVSVEPNFLESKVQTNDISDSAKVLAKDLKLLDKQIELANAEMEMLKANISIGGQVGVKVQELKEAVDFYSARSNKIALKQVELESKKEELQQKLNRYKAQLADNQTQTRTSDILVNITSTKADKVELDLNYLVRGASWEPFYDIRAIDGKSSINLAYRAKVSQKTGEDWNNVQLKLAGGNPSLSGTKPTLEAWYLNFNMPIGRNRMKMNFSQNTMAGAIYDAKIAEEEVMPEIGEVKQGMTNVEFNINLPYSIPSSGKAYVVDIQNNDLPASYVYYGVRRMEKEAFLVAKITEWEKLNLLAGETNLFLDGTFTGKSYIEPRLMKDTMELSLGRDNTILLTRVKGKDYSERKTLGSTQTDFRTWTLTARNTKNRPINLIIEDQIPISTHKDIEVIIEDISGAELNKSTGLLTWRLNLKASEQKVLTIKYSVKYPKNRILDLE